MREGEELKKMQQMLLDTLLEYQAKAEQAQRERDAKAEQAQRERDAKAEQERRELKQALRDAFRSSATSPVFVQGEPVRIESGADYRALRKRAASAEWQQREPSHDTLSKLSQLWRSPNLTLDATKSENEEWHPKFQAVHLQPSPFLICI